MDQKLPFWKSRKGLLVGGLLIVSLVGIPLTIVFLQQQQIFQQQAWHTTQSANASCGPDAKVTINVTFSNTESLGDSNAMNVTVKDLQTGGVASLGTVNPGTTKNGTIATTRSSIAAGGVVFTLTWTNGRSGTDTRTANYPAVASCVQPTATPTATPKPSLSPSPSLTPTTTLTPTPTSTPTLTPTLLPSVTPTDTPMPSETPTITIALSLTPTVTNPPTETPTPPPGSTETPTPPPGSTETPTPPAGSTNTPTTQPLPSIAPTGPGLLVGFGFAGVALMLLGGLLFFLL